MKITFLGGVETVTGSKYLVENEDARLLVDCGMFQGDRELSSRNRDPFPIDPSTIDSIILTHAHIDHTGYIPVLIKNGFKGKIYCSKATYELCSVLLVDSGHLQEEESRIRNSRNNYNHGPTTPLYTAKDAEYALNFFNPVDYDEPFNIGTSLQVTLIRSGHILGSSFVVITDGKRTLTFSGDLGRPHQLIMKSPPPIKQTDYLVLESTYGNRLHETGDPITALGEVIHEAVARGGMLVIPCFAVGRAQAILYCLYQLKQKNAIPNIPIFLDSPMASKVTKLYCHFSNEHTLSPQECRNIFDIATYTETEKESRKIYNLKSPAIVVSASGMATGGRIVQHLEHFISDPKSTFLFVGYQAEGNGRALIGGAQEIKIHGKPYAVRATVKMLNMLSAHADYDEILEWLSHFERSPKKVFITHGDMESAQSLQQKVEKRFGWPVIIPKYQDSFDLN